MIKLDLDGVRRPAAFLRNDSAAARSHKWYSVRNADGGDKDEAEILIYDVIGWWDLSAQRFAEELKKVTASTIRVRLNTPGGDVFDGVAIYNALRSHGAKIIVQIDGLAASIGSVIAMAGDEIVMGAGAFMMIHNAWGFSVGNAGELRELAKLLDKIDGTIAGFYAKRPDAAGDADHFLALMAEETWFTADEAVEAGLADRVDGAAADADEDKEEPAAAASAGSNRAFDLSMFNRVPDALRNKAPAKRPAAAPQTKRDIERILRDGGCSNAQAKAIAAQGYRDLAEPRDEDADALLSAVRAHVAANKQVLSHT